MEIFKEYGVFLIPLVILEIILAIVALVHVLMHENYKFGNKILWIIIVLGFSIVGPVVYFIFGRSDEE